MKSKSSIASAEGSSDTTWSKPENIPRSILCKPFAWKICFQIRTIGWNGQEGIPTSLSFRIKAPFWNQWWFYMLCVAVIAFCFIRSTDTGSVN
jgi:hypothetical protein